MKCCSKKGMSVIGRSNPIRYNREKGGWGQSTVHSRRLLFSIRASNSILFSHSCYTYNENAEMLLIPSISTPKNTLWRRNLFLQVFYNIKKINMYEKYQSEPSLWWFRSLKIIKTYVSYLIASSTEGWTPFLSSHLRLVVNYMNL